MQRNTLVFQVIWLQVQILHERCVVNQLISNEGPVSVSVKCARYSAAEILCYVKRLPNSAVLDLSVPKLKMPNWKTDRYTLAEKRQRLLHLCKAMTLEGVFRKINHHGEIMTDRDLISHLLFVNDCLLIAANPQDFQHILQKLANLSRKIGLEMNLCKRK